MSYLEVDSGEVLCYRRIDSLINPREAKTIIFVHPNFLSQRSWEPLLKYFTHFNVYTFDMRGFGKSTYINKLTSISDFSNDLISFCSKLNLTNVSLIGWSLGGAVCMDTALLAPSLVESMTLMGSVSHQGFPFMTKNGREKDVEKIKQRLRKFEELLALKDHQRIFPRKNVCENSFLEIIFEQIESQRNYSDATSQLGVWDISKSLNKIQCPILFYHGTEDIVIPFENALFNYNSFKKHNPKTFLCQLQGGSHSPLYEVPKDISQLFIEFINNHSVNHMIAKL